MNMKRRKFLNFLGRATVGSVAVYSGLPMFSSSCKAPQRPISVAIKGLQPSEQDDIILADGLNYNESC